MAKNELTVEVKFTEEELNKILDRVNRHFIKLECESCLRNFYIHKDQDCDEVSGCTFCLSAFIKVVPFNLNAEGK